MNPSPHHGSVHAGRLQRIIQALQDECGKVFGRTANEMAPEITFIALGADSLALLRVSHAVQERLGIKVPFRRLMTDLTSIADLGGYLESQMPEEEEQPRAPDLPIPATPQIAASEVQNNRESIDIKGLLRQQLKVMALQLELLGSHEEPALENIEAGNGHRASLSSIGSLTVENHVQPDSSKIKERERRKWTDSLAPQSSTVVVSQITLAQSRRDETHATSAVQATTILPSEIEPEVYVPYQAIQAEATKSLSDGQRKHLTELIEHINRRTNGSKRITQEYRKYHADNRTAAGFTMPWKEMFYPLVVERGHGSHIWDVDGNEYIDMTMGFGALLFGHSPSFITETLTKELTLGLRLGPHSREAGEAAQLICELTGVERVAFCNSGTEAIMTALRLARTVTGRSRIALFEGCYHGTFDGVLVRGERRPDGSLQAVPLAPGIPSHMIENVLMLKYDDRQSLDILESQADQLAAVLIEPPRSRRPDVQPKNFLQELRRITEASSAALIFDEMVTGFRFNPGGAQAMFGIRADLVTYGKALGGGLPVAAVGGKSRFMDAVDGGMWQYGDGSYPEADITFFTGTYFKHPLIMPAVVAVLKHIKQSGFRLQESLNAKAKYVAEELDAFFKAGAYPLRVAQLGSLFRILHGAELRYMDLFYYHLLAKGIYVCETHNCLVSTAHSDADMEAVIRATKETVLELREAGFLPGAPSIHTGSANPARADEVTGQATGATIRVPLTEAQRHIL
jgi:glutamate-1-semialdehyde aminotransferase/acyl carrier protein